MSENLFEAWGTRSKVLALCYSMRLRAWNLTTATPGILVRRSYTLDTLLNNRDGVRHQVN
ncbi:MAG: hypothetical protein HC939_19905 [Pleurocapsa sp. SU_5_0]|nr:hypothetical protein [Pleurocapsa sp. SU_5_0]NJO97474.1 hypothetical protein [Pleurocapsa sp. CRU_1_2]NJR45408.1 hypothetical protein [Hyellaceae cyanobacterium CSU_1_1]